MIEKINTLGNSINASDKILLLTHLKMDGDAIGSLGSLYYILMSLGKIVKTTNDSLPGENFEFLGANDIFIQDLDINEFNPDLVICLDTGSIEQLGNIYEDNREFFNNREIVVIDHHASNSGFGSLNIIDHNTSSTCEILFLIYETLGLTEYIDSKIANLLISGIVTDTNIFYNLNTTRESLETTGKLLSHKGDLHKIIYEFYNKSSFSRAKLKGIALNKMGISADKKIVWAMLTQDDFDLSNASEYDTSGIINNFINIDTCEIAILLYVCQYGVKVSFRSKSYDVSKLASSFPGGGGHKLAAGFRIKKDIHEVLEEILKRINI